MAAYVHCCFDVAATPESRPVAVSLGGGEGGGNRLAERDSHLIDDSGGQQVMVVVVVPESELRSLLGTNGSPTPVQGTAGVAAHQWNPKKPPQYVVGNLSVDALQALLKRQGDRVLVLQRESASHRPAGTGGPVPERPAAALTGDQEALDGVLGMPSTTTGDDRLEEDPLSPREMEILALVAKGVGNNDLSETLFITLNTVKSHMKNIMRKLKTKDRNQTALVARIICGGSISDGSRSE